MTKRTMVVFAAALCACGPNYQDGKTECSDKYECPSGYACSSVQKGATPICYRVENSPCTKANPFYCSWAKPAICAPSPAHCPEAVATGGTGGGGGPVTGPSSCTDPEYPVYCPASGTVAADCWGAGADCSTIVSCGVDDDAACSVGRKVYCAADNDNRCCVPPAPGGTCNLPACGCPAGQVCYPNTKATGLACIASHGLLDGELCSGKVCAEGFGCFGGMCSPYCQVDSDCPAVDGARACDPTYWEKDQPIDGVSVCSRVCDPVTPQSPRIPLLACPVGYGCTAGESNPGASDCIRQAGTLPAGSTCTTTSDCAPGHYCTTGSICNKYCFTSADCPTGISCNFFSSPRYAGSAQVGYCK